MNPLYKLFQLICEKILDPHENTALIVFTGIFNITCFFINYYWGKNILGEVQSIPLPFSLLLIILFLNTLLCFCFESYYSALSRPNPYIGKIFYSVTFGSLLIMVGMYKGFYPKFIQELSVGTYFMFTYIVIFVLFLSGLISYNMGYREKKSEVNLKILKKYF